MAGSRHIQKLYRDSFDPIFTSQFYQEDLEREEGGFHLKDSREKILVAALMRAIYQIVEKAVIDIYQKTFKNKDAHSKTLQDQYVGYFLAHHANVLGIKPVDNVDFSLDEKAASVFVPACIEKLHAEFTLQNVLSQLAKNFNLTALTQDFQDQLNQSNSLDIDSVFQASKFKRLIDAYQFDETCSFSNFFHIEKEEQTKLKKVSLQPDAQKVLEILFMHCLFQMNCLREDERIGIPLPSGEQLYLLFGKNTELSYVQQSVGKYSTFPAYYKKLDPSQQEEVRKILVERAEKSPYQREHDSIVFLGKAADKAVKKKGDFHLDFVKAGILSLTEVDDSGMTLMMTGAKKGYQALVCYLANEAKETVDQVDNNGLSPLHFAAAHGHLDIVKDLVECGAALDQKDKKFRWTPLICAVRHQQTETVQWLLAKYNEASQAGKSLDIGLDEALLVALRVERFDFAHSLLVAGAAVLDRYNQMPHVHFNKFQKEKFAMLREIPVYSTWKAEHNIYPDAYFHHLKQNILKIYSSENGSEIPRDLLKKEYEEFKELKKEIAHFMQHVRSFDYYPNTNRSVWRKDIQNVMHFIEAAVIPAVYMAFERDKLANEALTIFVKQCHAALRRLSLENREPVLFKKPTPKSYIAGLLSKMEEYNKFAPDNQPTKSIASISQP